jgi:hypothetical protein
VDVIAGASRWWDCHEDFLGEASMTVAINTACLDVVNDRVQWIISVLKAVSSNSERMSSAVLLPFIDDVVSHPLVFNMTVRQLSSMRELLF